jgi:hypothetical protein
MNDSDFKPILVKDSRIGNITSQIGYGVFSGGASSTYTSYNAVSTTNNQLTFFVKKVSKKTLGILAFSLKQNRLKRAID